MNRRHLRRWAIASALLLAAGAAWLLWLRPIGVRAGPRPAALADGWSVSSPAAQGFDGSRLLATLQATLDEPLDVHSILVARHGRLVAEVYQGGTDRAV